MTRTYVDYLVDLIYQSDVYISFETAEKIIIHHEPLNNDLLLYGYTFEDNGYQERWIRFDDINLEKDMFFKLIPNELPERPAQMPHNYPLP